MVLGLFWESFQRIKQNSNGLEGLSVILQGNGYPLCSLQILGTHQTLAIA
jgi:hypothetical protein